MKNPMAWLEARDVHKIELGLEALKQAMQRLGVSAKLPFFCISIAGTNGKGSVVAVLEACLQAAGCKVGTYTSPHLVSVCERIALNGQAIDQADFEQLLVETVAKLGEMNLSYFEWVTLLACVYFVREQPDVVLFEVGLGGRLDAVNAIDADIAVVTSIGLDHQQYLGDTLEAIAVEKCGIFRRQHPAVYGGQQVREVIQRQASILGATLTDSSQFSMTCVPRERAMDLASIFNGSEAEVFTFVSSQSIQVVGNKPPGLLQDNLACALQVLCELPAVGLPLTLVDAQGRTATWLQSALQRLRLPGRLEFLHCARDFLLDVAHNLAAVEQLKQLLTSTNLSGYDRIVAVVGVMQDKPAQQMIEVLKPLVTNWLPVDLSMPRALSADALVEILTEVGVSSLPKCQDISRLYSHILAETKPDDLVIVFGSFFLLGPFYTQLELAEAYGQ